MGYRSGVQFTAIRHQGDGLVPLDRAAARPTGSSASEPAPTTFAAAPAVASDPKIDVASLNFYYGAIRALENVTLQIYPNQVTALIGPSGCGKSTFLRALNRMNDIVPGARVEGSIRIDGRDIYAPSVDVVDLRRRVGMVFQKSNPFPESRSSKTWPTGRESTG